MIPAFIKWYVWFLNSTHTLFSLLYKVLDVTCLRNVNHVQPFLSVLPLLASYPYSHSSGLSLSNWWHLTHDALHIPWRPSWASWSELRGILLNKDKFQGWILGHLYLNVSVILNEDSGFNSAPHIAQATPFCPVSVNINAYSKALHKT